MLASRVNRQCSEMGSKPLRRNLPIRVLNWTLRAQERAGFVTRHLEIEHLVEAARRRTGLSEFGDETFHEPLRRLLESCEKEAGLNNIGKLALIEDILQLLVNRLEIERDRCKWPGIRKERVIAPLFITGLPRTGTTLLHSLLAQDDRTYQAPATWEIMFPSPPPFLSQRNRKRIKRAERNLAWFDLLVPEFRKIHPMSAHFPQECIAIMSHAFISDQFYTMFNVPAYESWREKQDMRPVYAYHLQFLQHLQYGGPLRRFVLKAPAHMFSIEALFAIYPDAQVIQTHREPVESLPSLVSLMNILRTAFSDSVDPVAIGPVMTEFWKETLENFLTARNRLRSNSFLDVKYRDLVCDPIGVVRELYRNLGDHLSNDAERRMRSFLSKHPKGKYGSHFYTTASFGLDTATLDQHFDSYRERFGLKNTKLIVEERASEG
jgi:sulfotransferase family protein